MADRTVSVTLRANVAGFTASMAAARQSVSGLSKEFGQAARSNAAEMQTVGAVMAGIGVATVGAMGLSVKAAMDFESSFTGVRKTVDASEAEFGRLESGFRSLAKEIPSSVHEINAVGEAAGQLGISKENILGFTRTMLDLGETTNLTADEAATSMARLAAVTGMPQDEFDRLGSVVVDLGNNFATTESEIVDFGMRLAGAGTQIGLTEGEILAIGTALSSVGISAEAGGTAFSKVMINIAREVETGGDKLAKFAEVAGMTTEQFSKAWREDAAGALAAFVEGLGKVDEAGGSTFAVLEDLGITEQRMRDSLLRASGASGLLTDALGIQASAWEDNTALTKEAELRYGTAAAQIEIARNKVYDAAVTVGQTLAPAVAAAAGLIGDLAEGFTELPGPVQSTVAVLGSVGGLATAAAGGFLLMAPRVVATKDALRTLSATMPATTSALSAMKGVLLGPWGAAIAAGVTVLGFYAKAQADARRDVEELSGTLDTQTGAITTNTREWVAARLQQDGVLEAANRLGIELPLVTDAAMGNADAQKELGGRLQEVKDGFLQVGEDGIVTFREGTNAANADVNTLDASTGRLSGKVGESQEQFELQAEAVAETTAVYGGSQAAQDAYTARLQGMADKQASVRGQSEELASKLDLLKMKHGDAAAGADEQREALAELAAEQRAAVDPVFAMNRALDGVEEAQSAYTKAVDKHGPKSAEANDASWKLAEAVSGAEQAALDGDLSFREFSGKLNQWVAQGKITAGQADTIRGRVSDLRGEAEDYRGDYDAHVDALTRGADRKLAETGRLLSRAGESETSNVDSNTASAERKLFNVNRLLSSAGRNVTSTVTTNYRTTGSRGPGIGWKQQHSGGVVGKTSARHSGPLLRDEIPTVLQRDEFVMNRDASRQYGSLLEAMNSGRGLVAPTPSGGAGGGGSGGGFGGGQDLSAALSGMQWKLDIDPRGVATVTAKGNRQLAAFGGRT